METRKNAKVRMSLSYKLFGAFFLILAIVVGAMFLSRYIFTLNFRHYIKQVELDHLESLVPVLAEVYQQNANWDPLRKDPEGWAKRLEQRANIHRIPPPLFNKPDKTRGKNATRLLLLDENALPIIGIPEPADKSKIFPIITNGTTVGWLGIKKRKPFRDGPPEELLARQAKHLTLLGILVIGITLAIAVFFSRHLLKPVKQLIEGTQALANREFSVRIPPTTADELGRLAENFNEMAGTLEEYEALRKKWLTDISHELRTPLAILRGEMEAIEDGIIEITPSSISSLHSEVLRISKLVEDIHLLSLSESDSLSMDKHLCSPRKILEKSVHHFRSCLEQKEIEIQLMLDDLGILTINADEDRISQVFFNILDNSCKYIDPGGKLRITGTIKGDECCIRFDDSGPGVSKESLPQLFERLYREEQSRNRNTGGSGLGLAICRNIIEKHNGSIWAEESEKGGLAIVIMLPVAAIQAG